MWLWASHLPSLDFAFLIVILSIWTKVHLCCTVLRLPFHPVSPWDMPTAFPEPFPSLFCSSLTRSLPKDHLV